MRASLFARRFLIPGPLVSLWYYYRFNCFIHYRSEVDFSANLKIGRGTSVAACAKIKCGKAPLIIGENTSIADGCHIGSGVTIGNDCLIGPHVSIIGANYSYDRLDIPIRMQAIPLCKGTIIGNDVWVGAGACILDGARIGSGVIITPNSVVATKVPDNAVVQGNPAKVIFIRR